MRRQKVSFFKIFFAALLAILIGLLLQPLLVLWLASILSPLKTKVAAIPENAIVRIPIKGEIVERKPTFAFESEFFSKLSGEEEEVYGLDQILLAIDNAAKNKKVKALYLDCGALTCGHATAQEIREALKRFKQTSKKPIYAYGYGYTEKSIWIASVADTIFLFPEGYVEWNGLASVRLYLRGLLDKLGIEPIEFRMGKYKSAAEAFARKQMTPEERYQTQTLLKDLWSEVVKDLSQHTGLSTDSLNAIADNKALLTAEEALKYHFVHALKYHDEIEDFIKKRLGVKKEEKIPWVSYTKMAKAPKEKEQEAKIAVVYAIGPIGMGKGDWENIGPELMIKTLRKVKEDESIKAVVFRVNSPGGSALASDIIAREIESLKKVKPVIASYSDVAASGGYYISVLCDKIYAHPTSITGSIGVIGLLFNFQTLLSKKLGINPEVVKTNLSADATAFLRKFTPQEKQRIYFLMKDVYGDFISKVVRGRGLDSLTVDSLGQGRVWSGKRAKQHHLIDEVGGLFAAIDAAAKAAGIETYDIALYPKEESPYERFMKWFRNNQTTQLLAPIQQLLSTFTDPRGLYYLWLVDPIM